MRGTVDDAAAAHEIGNVRFLIEQQIQVIEDLDRRGLDGQSAHELLRRLMRRDEELRCRFFPLASRAVPFEARLAR